MNFKAFLFLQNLVSIQMYCSCYYFICFCEKFTTLVPIL